MGGELVSGSHRLDFTSQSDHHAPQWPGSVQWRPPTAPDRAPNLTPTDLESSGGFPRHSCTGVPSTTKGCFLIVDSTESAQSSTESTTDNKISILIGPCQNF